MRQGPLTIPKIKVPAGLVSSEASLFGLHRVALLLPLHMVFPLCTYIPGVSLCVQISSSYKNTHQIGLGPTVIGFILSPNVVTF